MARSNSGDLLQQAISHIDLESYKEGDFTKNELVKLVQNNGEKPTFIRITTEQAAAWGITFKSKSQSPPPQTRKRVPLQSQPKKQQLIQQPFLQQQSHIQIGNIGNTNNFNHDIASQNKLATKVHLNTNEAQVVNNLPVLLPPTQNLNQTHYVKILPSPSQNSLLSSNSPTYNSLLSPQHTNSIPIATQIVTKTFNVPSYIVSSSDMQQNTAVTTHTPQLTLIQQPSPHKRFSLTTKGQPMMKKQKINNGCQSTLPASIRTQSLSGSVSILKPKISSNLGNIGNQSLNQNINLIHNNASIPSAPQNIVCLPTTHYIVANKVEENESSIKNINALQSRIAKRGRPKKGTKTPTKSTDDEAEETKEDYKQITARTRSGRLSRPPRHMFNNYKDSANPEGDSMQGDNDDSDDDSDDGVANTMESNFELPKLSNFELQKPELLKGLEPLKRKISEQFKCFTCSKTYLGKSRITKHFELYPEHEGTSKLSEYSIEPDSKEGKMQKNKSRKKVPKACATPEAKSERRQTKLREALLSCATSEIRDIAAKPVASLISLHDLLLLKSGNDMQSYLKEIKDLVECARERVLETLSPMIFEDKQDKDVKVIDLSSNTICDVLGCNPGLYKIKDAIKKEEVTSDSSSDIKEERSSSGFSENSELSPMGCIASFDSSLEKISNTVNTTLLKSEPSELNDTLINVSNDSNTLSLDNEMKRMNGPGFQKISISAEMKASPGFLTKGTFTKLGGNFVKPPEEIFSKFSGNNVDTINTKTKKKLQEFIKLQPPEDGFIKIENGKLESSLDAGEDFIKNHYSQFHCVPASSADMFSINEKTFSTTETHTELTNAENASTPGDAQEQDKTDNFQIPNLTLLDDMYEIPFAFDNQNIFDDITDNAADRFLDEKVLSEQVRNFLPSDPMFGGSMMNGYFEGNINFDEVSHGINQNFRS